MTENRTVKVSILDKEYQIACQKNERDALHSAAAELDSRMRAIRNAGVVVGLDRIAVMAALNLCHEFQQIEASNHARSSIENDTLERMQKKIAHALESR